MYNEKFNFHTRGAWQITSEDTAPSPLLFQIGGVSSVRGYTQGVLGGAQGYYLNLETVYQWDDNLSPFGFIDHGMVDDISPDRVTITSAGFGLSWRYGRYTSAEVVWGQTLEEVTPDQDDGRLHARVSMSWPGM